MTRLRAFVAVLRWHHACRRARHAYLYGRRG